MADPIPILDLKPEIDALWPQLQEAIERVVRSGRFILGPEGEAFEGEAAEYLGVKHAVACNSGTDALVIGLRAVGVAPGDEVITTPFTFVATAEAIKLVGATPVFVDIDPNTFNIDTSLIAAAVTPRTKAVVPVHLFGQGADMDAVMNLARERGLKVIEDTAQAFGGLYKQRKLGTIGDVGAYSFFPSKNLGAFGDGGLMTTDDDAVAQAMRMLRCHGSKQRYVHEALGYNSRLDEIQAAVLRVKLPHVDTLNQKRREAAAQYDALLEGLDWITTPVRAPYAQHVFHQYTVRVSLGRDEVHQKLASAGVSTMIYYPIPSHRMGPYSGADGSTPNLPHAEQAAQEVLSLPMGPSLTEKHIERVVGALASV